MAKKKDEEFVNDASFFPPLEKEEFPSTKIDFLSLVEGEPSKPAVIIEEASEPINTPQEPEVEVCMVDIGPFHIICDVENFSVCRSDNKITLEW